MTNPDSLQAICAELRALPFGVFLSGQSNGFASRLERLDAEMRKDNAKLRASLVRACNATDGGCTDTVSNEFLSHVGEEVELCIAELRARLAACESTEQKPTGLEYIGKYGSPARLREAKERVLATQPTPDPNPSPSSQPYDAEGATVEHDPAKAKAMCTVCGDLVHMDDADEHCAGHGR